jgi:hypothetical protein
MELRYVKNGINWMPEYKSKSSGDWKAFHKDQVSKYNILKKLGTALAELGGRKDPYYSNTQEMYFLNEVEVMAWLGGVQGYFRDEVNDFEIFLTK